MSARYWRGGKSCKRLGKIPQSTDRPGSDGRTINTANIGRRASVAQSAERPIFVDEKSPTLENLRAGQRVPVASVRRVRMRGCTVSYGQRLTGSTRHNQDKVVLAVLVLRFGKEGRRGDRSEERRVG